LNFLSTVGVALLDQEVDVEMCGEAVSAMKS